MKLKLTSLYFAVLALASLVTQLHAQSTAFTYQGRLEQNGRPATGLYQMIFRLYDRELEGTPLTAFPADSVPVTNGLFSVEIDLDRLNVFPSDAWLEIFVATNGPAEFTLLEPRTPITPTPKANYAHLAGSVTNRSIGAEQIASSNKPDPGYMLTWNGDSLVWKDPVQTRNIWSLNGTNAFYNEGRVGIGTQTPAGKLHVSKGGLAVTGASSPFVGAGTGVFMESYPVFGTLFAFDYNANRPLPLGINSPGGNVGIGTLSPAGKLHVAGGGFAVTGASSPFVGAGSGVFMEGYPDFGTLFAYDYTANRPLSLAINSPGGNVGIGTLFPQSTLDIVSVQDALRMTGFQPFLTFLDNSSGNARSRIQSVGGEIFLATEGYLNGTKPHGYAKLNNDGNFSVASLTIRGGADLAEPFPMDETIEEGSVVVIDEDQAGRLKQSTRAYDRQVAGIVSGANGINPGISLQQEGALDQGRNVALTGRVYVKANATHGAIKAGDLLTTSDLPGHAMKVLDHAKAQGAILGKAMTSLAAGQGTVLVLVTLQ